MDTAAWYELETDGASIRVDNFLIPPSVGDLLTIHCGDAFIRYVVGSISSRVESVGRSAVHGGGEIQHAGSAVTVLHLNPVVH